MQKKVTINPFFLNTDIAYEKLSANETNYQRGLDFDLNRNPITGIGTNNPAKVGQNLLIKSQVASNAILPQAITPEGFNRNLQSFYSITTNELYYFNFNSNKKHGIYVLNGDTGIWNKVIEDSQLLFTDNSEDFIAGHRVSLRLVKDKSGNVIEKYLLITNGNTWQKYINVIAAIKTDGFNKSLFPYWNTRPPHFDRRELVEWPVRPPMVKSVITAIANTVSDKGKINRFVDKGVQIAYAYQYTDGRNTTLSPYSLPLLIKTEDYLTNTDDIPKNVSAKLYAGSCMTEKILVYVRIAKKNSNTLQSIQEWADWQLYDTLKRFPNSNSGNIVGSDYWLRTDQWSKYNYDNIFNTIDYVLDLSKVTQIVNQDDANQIQTEMPQLSEALTDLGDAVLLGDNRYGYPNFDSDVIDKFSLTVQEKVNSSCKIQSRTIRLYAGVFSPFDTNQWSSQVGYYATDDKSVVFGGIGVGTNNLVDVDLTVNTTFNLNFADKQAFRCYLKGTPYYADGEWYQVNSDNSLVKIPQLLDIREISVKEYIQKVFVDGGYFVCVFDITAPAGKYIATLGRHNVSSAGDYKNTSTYIYGIANSRKKTTINVPRAAAPLTTIKPDAINNTNGILYSKEMEIDCTSANVDVWGNGADLFYVYCPYITGNHEWRFIEGYVKEEIPPINGTSLAVELFPYRMVDAPRPAGNDWGQFTDKNGFYWGYVNSFNPRSNSVDMQLVAKVNCSYPTYYEIATVSTGSGWKQNVDTYIANYNGGSIGNANRILYNGKITSLDGSLTYSNIAISIKDGATVYSKTDGTFTLIIHNGRNVLRQSNVYVNAGGNFSITIAGCGDVALQTFSESIVPCVGNAVRTYPYPLNLAVQISTDRQESLKDSVKYSVACYGADLAGRVMYANVIDEPTVPSFLQRNNINATYFQLAVNAGLDLTAYPDMAYLIFCVSKNLSIKRYLDWIGDEINYIDNNGNKVIDPSSAVFCSIKINSLFNSNVAKNFSLLSSYQFVAGDRVRILDDGNGNLFDTATYGDPIDLQILGTNYFQAAVSSGLLPPDTNTVLSSQTVSPDVTLIVRYDPRLDKLIQDKGFWIEIYTPIEQSETVPFYDDKIFPIINGKPSEFTGYVNGVPQYNFINIVNLDFWDTYFFDRSITIPNVGNKYFSHPFQSQNVTDNWGADLISGGRNNTKNDAAKQYWLGGETIKSDDFLKEGLINGLGTFRSGNKKDFGTYPYGAIVGMYSARNILLIVCENDWLIADFNRRYAYVNETGVLVANLDNGLTPPHEKVGDIFGLSKSDTATLLVNDKDVYWYDRKNTAYIRCNFSQATDVTAKSQSGTQYKIQSEQGGMQSYFNAKSDFITKWNNENTKENSFDVISGFDVELNKIYLTFRCRRNNSQALSSFINDRRDWQVDFQETIVYDSVNHGWLRAEGFAPEGYGSLRGNSTGTQLISFASGKPYLHKTNENGFNQFYGIQTQAVLSCVINDLELPSTITKEFDAIFYAGNPSGWYIDKIYTDFKNSFSYLSYNQFSKLLNNYYAGVMKNMVSYPSNNPNELFRSMLLDGYFVKGRYAVVRFVCDYNTLNDYKEIGDISALISIDDSNIKQ